MIEKKSWVLNERTGRKNASVTVIDEEENDLDFCIRFYKSIGYNPIGVKYDEFDELLTRPIGWDKTEFLGLILK